MGAKISALKNRKEKIRTATQKKRVNTVANIQQFARKSGRKLERLAEAYNRAEAMTTQFATMLRLDTMSVEMKGGSIQFSYYVRSEKRSFRARELKGVRVVAKDLYVEGYLTETLGLELANFLYKEHWSFLVLKTGYICCSPDQLNRLVEATKAKSLICNTIVPTEFLGLSSIKKINDLHASSYLSDIEMLDLKMPKIYLERTNVSSFGIHKLLKEWLTGKRNILSITIETEQELNRDLIFDGIAYSAAESPDSNEEAYIVKKLDHGMIVTLEENFVFLHNTQIYQ